MRFNINETVRVKLNEDGLRILEARHTELYQHIGLDRPFAPPQVDDEGYSRFQLWTLMREFGPHIRMGMKPPFDTTIDIPDAALRPLPTPNEGSR
jgi:repressor LexA